MKKITITFLVLFSFIICSAQINPLDSPYYAYGPYAVVVDSNMTTTPDVLIFRPSQSNDGPYPTVLFQPGANSGTAYINKHSYDLYWRHLASFGYVVIIMNNTSGGPNSTLFKNMHDWIKTQVTLGSGWMNEYIDLTRFIVSGHSNGGMNATDIVIDRPNEIQSIVYMASYPNPGIYGIGAQNVSNYTGKVYLMCGSEDGTSLPLVGSTNEIAKTAFDARFTNASCKSWTLFTGLGHGGFGDYNNPAQPVGTIGREPATASIRHMLVSFLNSQFRYDATAFDNFSQNILRPNSVGEFQNSCTQVVGINNEINYTDVLIYPNPVNDKLIIKNNKLNVVQIQILDLQGKILNTTSCISNYTIEIPVNHLNPGAYLINISATDFNKTYRFMKF